MNIRMSTKGKRPLRSLTPSDKIHAIQRIHDGESKASVARDIGVPESTLRGWCKNEDKLRFMSRQSVSDKIAAESLSDKLEGAAGLLGGPPEKRQKMDANIPLNFSNKIKFDELAAYKRSPLNGLDYSTNKALSDLSSFNGLTPDYAAFNGAVKNKIFGADVSRQAQTDPSLAAISPLSSLSHLSGLTGLAHSPLAISFNELTSNLSLLAQLNPGLAAMSGLNGLNGLAATSNTLRNMKPKPNPTTAHSPRSERGCSANSNNGERQGISVRNWAKQKPLTPTSNLEANTTGLNLSQPELKNKMKCPSPSLAPSLGNNLPPSMTDDPLLYWLKSQQAMLGLSSLYPPPTLDAASPPIRSSTPQQNQLNAHTNTPPMISTPLTPSSTPSGSLDDKNTAWFNWCKAFGASISSLAPAAAAAAMQGHPLSQIPTSNTADEVNAEVNLDGDQKPFENILYSQLTKDTDSNSIKSTSTADNVNGHEMNGNTGKPEDLSAKTQKSVSPAISPLPTPAQSPDQSQTQSLNTSRTPSPAPQSEDTDIIATAHSANLVSNVAKDVLDDILYKMNKNAANNSFEGRTRRESLEGGSDSNNSYNSADSNHNNNIAEHNNNNNTNNNNNSNKTDEEERIKCDNYAAEEEEEDNEESEAIRHGEKFLKWLENCSNPRVTTVQLMQLRFLISAIKSNSETKPLQSDVASSHSANNDDIYEDANRGKGRRRK